jgi:hypothetical protein
MRDGIIKYVAGSEVEMHRIIAGWSGATKQIAVQGLNYP